MDFWKRLRYACLVLLVIIFTAALVMAPRHSSDEDQATQAQPAAQDSQPQGNKTFN